MPIDRPKRQRRNDLESDGVPKTGRAQDGDCPDFRVSENGTVPFAAVRTILSLA